MSVLSGRHRSLPLLLAIVFTVVLLGGCAVVKSLNNMFSGMLPALGQVDTPDRLSITADVDANQGYPVAIDLLTVADKDAFATLSKLRAAEWFAGKRDYQRQYQKNIHVHSWEIVPGRWVDEKNLVRVEGEVVGALLFVDYIGDKTFRATVTGFPQARLELKADDFSVYPH